MSNTVFTYGFHIDSHEEELTRIRIYGLNENNKNVCLIINDFTPYVYLELPVNVFWNETKSTLLLNHLTKIMGSKYKPVKSEFLLREKLYGAHLDNEGKKILFPFLFLSFLNKKHIRTLMYKIKDEFFVNGIGKINLKMHEQDADPILQLCCCSNIPTAGWIKYKGKKLQKENKTTLCDFEYNVKYKNIRKQENVNMPSPKIMGFDIEVNSSNPSAMPDSKKPGDKVFQISCVFSSDENSEYDNYLLTLGETSYDYIKDNINIHMFNTEAELLEGFCDLICEQNPNVIVGYNILGFDIPYMIGRAKFCRCISKFDMQGFTKYSHAQEKIIKWSSSAYGTQEFEFLDAEGRIYVDLLPLVKRDFKMDNYKLKTVSDYFLGESKDPLSVKGIFKCYRVGTKKNDDGTYSESAKKAIGLVGTYCVQDSALTVKLMYKLQTWIGLCEMANTCCVPIFSLYTQGQQIKVFSQVYKHCMEKKIIVEKDGYIPRDDERYVGAHVFPPVPGVYDRVVPFDFSSLYPTTIIAYNIDYSTLVSDNDNISDDKCHVMEWEDHIACCHDPKIIRKTNLSKYIDLEKDKLKKLRAKKDITKDTIYKKEIAAQINTIKNDLSPYIKERSDLVKTISKNCMCAKRKYKFLKNDVHKGVIPTILQNLLDARKNTRKEIKKLKSSLDSITDDDELFQVKSLINVLDKRQLSYKVSANSMYGAMGVKRGYLPFMPGAMATTYMGRTNIELVAKTIPESYGGQLIYGDTDCVSPCTPLMINENNKIMYKTAEEISDGNWSRINPNKEISQAKPGYKIWSDKGFTEIKNVVRCGVKKPVSRILVHTGHVICSNEHSLLRENLESVKPCDLNLKEKLCITNLPLPKDTPNKPIYPNNLTAEKIRDYIISDEVYENLSAHEAFVWGVFFGHGSCGVYETKWGPKTSWVINKADNLLLERCASILRKYEAGVDFKILDTMKSCKANKLKPISSIRGSIVLLVEKYRELFYNDKKLKRVPDILFNAPYKVREAFFMGYYAGDGSKKDPALTITNKGEIGTAGLFFIMRSIGYQVSINTRKDKPDTYKLIGSSPEKKQRYAANAVKKIEEYANNFDYIYDIETENHHFAAGVGEMVVHNSNYIHFPHLKTAQETWDYAEYVAAEVTKLFPKPINLEFEEVVYWRFFILTKKRYMYQACLRDGVVDKKVGKKGVLLARRDNSKFIRDIYEKTITDIFSDVHMEDVLFSIIKKLNELCSNVLPIKDFVITKAIGSIDKINRNTLPEFISNNKFLNEKDEPKLKIGNYTVPYLPTEQEDDKHREKQLKLKNVDNDFDYYISCLPAAVQLAERMKRRGKRVDAGSRLEYVVTDKDIKNGKQYDLIEDSEYFATFSEVLNMNFEYYLKLIINPMDQLLNTAYYKKGSKFQKDFIKNQYEFRYKIRNKVIDEINELSSPVLIFQK